MKRDVIFIATYGVELAIAKIKYGSGCKYAVVRGVDYSEKCWDYSLDYFDDEKEAKKRFAEKILEDFEPEVDVVYSIYADTPKGRELVSTPNTEAQAKEAMLDYWNREGDSYEYELVVNKMQDIF